VALLRPGDTVDVVAPGFRCSDEALAAGVESLRRLQLVPRVPVDLFGPDLLCANSDAQRLRQLRAALAAPDSRAVWCVRGGYGAIRIIERLRKLTRPARAKLFVGYSDATTIHYLLNLHWRWPSLHGPLLDRLGAGTLPQEDRAELEGVLFGTLPSITFAALTPLNRAARSRRRVRSTVFGGNLTVLQTVLGTALQRSHRRILFLEDIGERGYRLDRTLAHLAQSGALAGLQALIFGSFTGGDDPDGGNRVAAVLERFAQEQDFPVLGGLPAGHGERQRPLFFNSRAELRCGEPAELTIDTPVLMHR
jgi:muramoyltetrapeptide carboxypeptidase